MRIPSHILAVRVALCLGLAPAAGWAGVAQAQAQERSDDPEFLARMRYQAGLAKYDAGLFAEAAEEFEAAYEASPRPALLYNIYLARRDAGQMEQAIDALRRYLPHVDDEATHHRLEARLATMEEMQRAHGSAATSTRQDPGPTPTASPAAGRALTIGGAALLAGGVTAAIVSLVANGDLNDQCPDRACTTANWRATRDRRDRAALSADLLMLTGAAAALVGSILLIRRGHSSRATPVAACDGTGCTAGLRIVY